ncbi:septal ring lytic transglycosylase RlpA family protein [Fibrella forsythiae]|uniref:Probable endolytic peptidoglycan transglycosylase RlpA n=1 Tax=Fibrella forsythiae TaxID=2817061 RepID=A0ABS3JFP7_9BACT|nr:septal ring lytic transglycosylase RlpA family protein [Fibrella forsythiae]MBO0948800.1 septal ring lytic transglycosylase RlpA family protein [Fibrella forsythiae]
MSLLMSLLLFSGSIHPTEAPEKSLIQQEGKASYYANKFDGRRTSSGERVKQHIFTGAHRFLPFNTLVEVTNKANQQSVIIRINDRGPFTKGRVVDMTYAAAKAIGMLGRGVANVTLRVVDPTKIVALLDHSLTLDRRSPLLPDLMPVL